MFLENLAGLYSRVTGRPVERVTAPMRKFMASGYRVHGDESESVLRELHASGGETDLLLRFREALPRQKSRYGPLRDVSDLIDGLEEDAGAPTDLPIELDYPRSAWEIGE